MAVTLIIDVAIVIIVADAVVVVLAFVIVVVVAVVVIVVLAIVVAGVIATKVTRVVTCAKGRDSKEELGLDFLLACHAPSEVQWPLELAMKMHSQP